MYRGVKLEKYNELLTGRLLKTPISVTVDVTGLKTLEIINATVLAGAPILDANRISPGVDDNAEPISNAEPIVKGTLLSSELT